MRSEHDLLRLAGWLMPLLLQGCASLGTLDAAGPETVLIYSGTRLDWYVLHDGCCAEERFGVAAPEYPQWDLLPSLMLDTLLLPFTLAASLGLNLGFRGGS